MRDLFSRRQWLAGLLSLLGGSWLWRRWPPAATAAAAPAPPGPPPAPSVASADVFSHGTTLVYDGPGAFVSPVTLATTFVYDPAARSFRLEAGPS